MSRVVIWIASFLIVIAVACSAAPDEQSPFYNSAKLFDSSLRRLQNSEQAKELNPLEHLQIGDVDENFVFQSASAPTNSSKCVLDIQYAKQNIQNQWALQMFDSYGKPESGILQGNIKWVGDYTECLNVRATNPNSTSEGNFRGQYCLLTWSLDFLNISLPFSFVSGVCIPDSCSPADYEDVLQLLQIAGVLPISNASMTVTNSSLTCKPMERHLNVGAKATIALLSLFGALVVFGSSITAARYIKKAANRFKDVSADDTALLQDDDTTPSERGWLKGLEKFLVCFCVFKNGSKLLNTDSSDGEQLLCIHGIRFLSMSWVIFGHSYIFPFPSGTLKNILEVLPLIDNFPFQVMLQGFYSVDSFFVLSGFLLAYMSMKEFSRSKGQISWTYFYVHRYLRLTPMYMVLLAFSATVFFYLGAGPYWPDGDYDAICKKKWWRNLLYINNFDIESGECVEWAWYLANDMQFFVISPLFLITLWRWPVVGYCLLAIFLCATCACNFYITYHYDLIGGIVTLLQGQAIDYDVFTKKYFHYYEKLYSKPYNRIGPYLVGILTGYILYKRKESKQQKHSWLFLCTGWILASSVTLTCVYGLYHQTPSLLATSFYNAFNRTCFAMGLSWVIYVCLIGQGGVVDRILSFKLFIPLSRLTYTAYLIHPFFIIGYYWSMKSSQEFSHPTMVTLSLGFLLTTYAFALPVSLILESPLVSLEKLVRKHFMQGRKTEQKTIGTAESVN